MNEIRELLLLRGITDEALEGCPVVEAAVVVSDAGLRLTVDDLAGRRETVEVSDSATAATVAESWVSGSIDGPLLEAHAAPGTFQPPVEPPSPEPAVEDEGADHAVEERVLHFSLGLDLSASGAGDGSAWIAPALAGCYLFRLVCVGASIRGVFDLGYSGDALEFDTRRLGVDVLLTVEVLFRRGSLVLAPDVGFGVGWLRSSFVGEAAAGHNVTVDVGGLRIEGGLALRVPLGHRFAFELSVRVGLSPLARTAPSEEEGFVLAGEPFWSAGGGVGLRFGGI